jgi:hypothetical protein
VWAAQRRRIRLSLRRRLGSFGDWFVPGVLDREGVLGQGGGLRLRLALEQFAVAALDSGKPVELVIYRGHITTLSISA